MSKLIALTNALVAAPAFSVDRMGLSAVVFTVADGTGAEVTLRVPRSQAARIANAINGVVNGQTFEALEIAERDGTITEAQVKSLAKRRDARERTVVLNAQRSADAAARKAGKPAKGAQLKLAS